MGGGTSIAYCFHPGLLRERTDSDTKSVQFGTKKSVSKFEVIGKAESKAAVIIKEGSSIHGKPILYWNNGMNIPKVRPQHCRL